MNLSKTERGFWRLTHPTYPDQHRERLLQESSAIGDYKDAPDKAGSSFLWLGAVHHLNRKEVEMARDLLSNWLKTGRLGDDG